MCACEGHQRRAHEKNQIHPRSCVHCVQSSPREFSEILFFAAFYVRTQKKPQKRSCLGGGNLLRGYLPRATGRWRDLQLTEVPARATDVQ